MVLNKDFSENLAMKFRCENGFNVSEAIDMKTVLRKLNILTIYLPMSESAFGLSLSSSQGDKFILVNSNTSKGRQHFTIAHELYHLFYDENPKPHLCVVDGRSSSEKKADAFAAALLMPENSILNMIPVDFLKDKNIPIDIVLRIEHYFRVSREAILYRLKKLKYINEDCLQRLLKLPKKQTAIDYGYETTLYEDGNHNLIIGNYGEQARKLFEAQAISEGHYLELLNKIQNGKEENSIRC